MEQSYELLSTVLSLFHKQPVSTAHALSPVQIDHSQILHMLIFENIIQKIDLE